MTLSVTTAPKQTVNLFFFWNFIFEYEYAWIVTINKYEPLSGSKNMKSGEIGEIPGKKMWKNCDPTVRVWLFLIC